MRYQEKVSTRDDIRSLYGRVKEQPAISHYRGYTATKSYGWDEETNGYIKADGEMWFENPYYDPDFFATHNEEQPMNEMKPEDVMRALECCGNMQDCDFCPYNYGTHGTCYSLEKDALALLREKDARIKELEEAQGAEFTCFVGEPHKVDHCPYGDELVKKDAEIERLRAENGIIEKRLDEAETNIELLEDAVGDVSDDEVEQIEKLMAITRAEAITEFADFVCEGRVSNDPVVIAVRCAEKEMKESD